MNKRKTKSAEKPKQKYTHRGSLRQSKPIRAQETSLSGNFGIDADDNLYRTLGGRNQQDLTEFEHLRAILVSEWLYARDPLAARMVDLPIIGVQNGGVKVYSKNPAINEVLIKWWDEFEPLLFGMLNHGLLHLAQIYGELSIPFFVHQYGYVEYGYLNPKNIEKILKKTGNALIFDKIVMRRNQEGEQKEYEIMRSIGGKWLGDVFHYGLYMPTNASRGRPFLYRFIDYLEMFGQYLVTESERASLLKHFVYMVTLNGASPEQCLEWLQSNFPEGIVPKPGTVRAKNENEQWEVQNPSLNAQDTSKMMESMKLNALGGAGFPIFFYGYGGDVNNQVSREMMTVAGWQFSQFQKFLGRMIKTMARHRVDMAIESGAYTTKGILSAPSLETAEEDEIIVRFGNPIPRDEVQASGALANIVNAVTGGLSSDVMSKQLGRELILVGANMLGVEKDMKEHDAELEADAVAKEKEKSEGVVDLYKKTPYPAPGQNGNAKPEMNFDGERPNLGELDGEE